MKQTKIPKSAVSWPDVYAFLEKSATEAKAKIENFLEKNPKWLAHVERISCDDHICISFGINPAKFPKRPIVGIDSVGGKAFCKPTVEETNEAAVLMAQLFPRGKNLSARFTGSRSFDFLEYQIRIARYKPFAKKI